MEIVFDPSAAYDMCISYRPDCDVISGGEQRFPDIPDSRGATPDTRIEYVPVSLSLSIK